MIQRMTTSFKDYVKELEATLSDEEREMLDVFRAYYSTLRKRLAVSETARERAEEALEKIADGSSLPLDPLKDVTRSQKYEKIARQALAQSERKAS